MELIENEQKIFSGNADALIFNTFRKYTVTLTLTNKRVIVSKLVMRDEYLLEDIESAERFRAMFMNVGIRFNLKNGEKVSLATIHIKRFAEELQKLGKM